MIKNQQSQYDYLLKLLNKPVKSEKQLQSKCAEILYWFYPDHWKRFVCVNNNDRRANTANVGIVPGVTDTYWLADKGKTIYIEFKYGTNKQSDKQIEWQAICKSLSHLYLLCYSEVEFWEIIDFKQPELADILNLSWFDIK